MKISRILFILAWLIVFSGISGCSSEKDLAQRRNLMIPQKDELPRNSKYIGVKKKKTHKPSKKKCNKHKKLTWLYSGNISGRTFS
jgi:hypothetical protein